MSEALDKLDHPLRRIHKAHQERRRKTPVEFPPGTASHPHLYSVSLRYEGSLSEIEKLGFKTSWNDYEGLAHGIVDLDDLERISTAPGVVAVEFGERHEPSLYYSAPDIRARSIAPADIGTKGVWSVDTTTGDLAPSSLNSGKGVVVGIIDTGIDAFNPVFMNSLSPFDTRILRIWDQGQDPDPAHGEKGPDKALITSANTYGVEFNSQMINDHLNGVSTFRFRHRDCLGHGTHVAATAAGNGNPGPAPLVPSSPPGFYYVGIAPRADIVVVKYLDVKIAILDTGGSFVSEDIRFRDAIRYILNIAKGEGKPCVINCSFGSDRGPHDGLTTNEQFIDKEFGPQSGFHKGNVVVFAAGNSGSDRTHAQITIPASGQIIVPFQLYDERGPNQHKFVECNWVEETRGMYLAVWYKEVSPPGDVSVAVRPPTVTAFSAEVFSGELPGVFDRNKSWLLEHHSAPKVKRPVDGGSPVDVQRNVITLTIEPNTSVAPPQHRPGIYELRIKGPAGTILHAWTRREARGYGIRIGPQTTLAKDAAAGDGPSPHGLQVEDASHFAAGDGVTIKPTIGDEFNTTVSSSDGKSPGVITINDPLPNPAGAESTVTRILQAEIDVNDHNQVGDEAGAKFAIAVAAYDDADGFTVDPRYATITPFSSRGPLVDYSGLGPYAPKPDIAAPGARIKAAQSRFEESIIPAGSSIADPLTRKSGTSMAAPHVTGAIALFLEKNRNLAVEDVAAILAVPANERDGADPKPTDHPEYTLAFGGGMLDVLKSLNAL